MKIFLPEPGEIAQIAQDLLRESGHQLVYEVSEGQSHSIEVIFIRTYTVLSAKYLAQFPNLEVIIRAGTGLDNIDLAYCQTRGIKVISSPGANAVSVAEHALTSILILLKNYLKETDRVKLGAWRDRTLMGSELSGKTVGLIGCGAVGKKLANFLLAFSVRLLGYDKYLDFNTLDLPIIKSSLQEVLSQSDVISIQIPLTTETNNLIDTPELALVKQASYLVNVSRGEVVNESALIHALGNQKLKGAALDVVLNEPTPNPKLLALPNVIITPHIAGFTDSADLAISVVAAQNFINYLKEK